MRSTRSLSWSRRLLGLDPLPVPPDVFLLEPGRLAYARVDRSDGGMGFLAQDGVGLPADLFADGPLGGTMREPAHLREQLRGLLARGGGAVERASLVLPDGWLRVVLTEAKGLTGSVGAREEVLRWKLSKLVPFRVEELRLRATEACSLNGEPRVLLGFAIDQLLRQIEESFADLGVRLGLITNRSLSLLAALDRAMRGLELAALVQVGAEGYSLSFTRAGELAVCRFRALAGSRSSRLGSLVLRDLKLTRDFIRHEVSPAPLGRLLLVGREGTETGWSDWLEEVFEVVPLRVGYEHLGLAGEAPGLDPAEAAPLMGAARMEVW